MANPSQILCVCGARPNFMKIAPIMRAIGNNPHLKARLVHTGQHYDEHMNDRFFRDLEMTKPDVHLEVGSGSHAVQTARVLERFEPVVIRDRPDWVLVVGDVNSTLACALVAAKLSVPVIHVEAGLRSFDRTMPEEINRILTDAISDLLFVTEESAIENLRREGVDPKRVHFVGNVMIDSLIAHRHQAAESSVLLRLGLSPQAFSVLTLHRPSNVDEPAKLGELCDVMLRISKTHPVVFPVHPRTRAQLRTSGLESRIAATGSVRLLDPIGYVEFISLISHAAVVLTDSGGVQEETTVLGVPCLTLRNSTERPVTITGGTNRLVGTDPERIVAGFRDAIDRRSKPCMPPLWDGKAAERIALIIASRINS